MRSTFKILFYVNRSKVKSDGMTSILCRITIDGKVSTMSTGLFCPIASWDVKKGLCAEARTNKEIQACRSGIEKAYTTLLERDGVVTAERIKQLIQKGDERNSCTLCSLGEEVLNEIKSGVGRLRKESTYKKNEYSHRKLLLFLSEHDLLSQKVTEIKEQLIKDYDMWLEKAGYAVSNRISLLRWLSRLMHRAVSKRMVRIHPFEDFKYERCNPRPRFLHKYEIQRIIDMTCNHPKLVLARDLFVFGCFTGLAISDICNLRYSNISRDTKGRKYIRKKRSKTDVESFVPLHPTAEALIERYTPQEQIEKDAFIFPIRIAEVGRIRPYLSSIGRICGISEDLGFHVARHSFATMALGSGISMESIAKMMGHRSVNSTQIYAQITDLKISREMDCLQAKRTNRLSR